MWLENPSQMMLKQRTKQNPNLLFSPFHIALRMLLKYVISFILVDFICCLLPLSDPSNHWWHHIPETPMFRALVPIYNSASCICCLLEPSPNLCLCHSASWDLGIIGSSAVLTSPSLTDFLTSSTAEQWLVPTNSSFLDDILTLSILSGTVVSLS